MGSAPAADPELLVLQDPTTAVDSVTEQRITAQLREHRPGRRTLVFSTAPAWNAASDERITASQLRARLAASLGEGEK